jgi:hypothetical protein
MNGIHSRVLGLEWVVGPDKDTTWKEARSWVQSLNLDGGGWRMPTVKELEGLYRKGTGERNITPFLKTTGWWVWSGETEGLWLARTFNFQLGLRNWYYRDVSESIRALAARPRSDKSTDKGRLFVDMLPSGATVRILNIGPKFYQGMELKPGRYHVETSKQGYETQRMWVNLKAGEDKKLKVRLEQLQASIQPTITPTRHPASTSDVIKRDGFYVAYANGIVKDTKTGLEWKVGPDRDTDWDEARSWVQSLNLNGGGWRMPTMDELEGLYKKGMESHNLTSLLLNTTSKYLWVWSGETKGSSAARYFNFNYGSRCWIGRGTSYGNQAFAVRSRGDG